MGTNELLKRIINRPFILLFYHKINKKQQQSQKNLCMNKKIVSAYFKGE